MKPEYRYAVIDAVNGFRVTNYMQSPEKAQTQKDHCFKSDNYKVGKFKIELVEESN